ncbi:hypothetical protein ES705_20760 [subsurface metagenome]
MGRGDDMSKVWNYLKVVLGIIFSVIVYLFFTRKDNRKIKKAIDEVNKKVDIEKAKVKEIEKKVKKRKEMTELRKGEAEILDNKLKKHFRKGGDK